MAGRAIDPRNKDAWRAEYARRGSNLSRMYSGRADDIDELRRQQAAFHDVERNLDVQNSWMAAATLAPLIPLAGEEIGGLLGARIATQPKPWFLPKREPWSRGGDFYANRLGRIVHRAYDEAFKAKDGWSPGELEETELGKVKPDGRTPARPKAPEGWNVEVKPKTPSGRRAGARQARRYEEATGRKTRVIYYDPEDWL